MNLKEYLKNRFSSPKYILEVGVMSDKTKRREKVKVGMTNAELMFIHENGSPLRDIPARPVLEMTIKWANESGLLRQTMSKIAQMLIVNYDEDKIDNEIKKLCLKIQNYARQIIYSNDGRLVANAPSTIKRKGDNHPLFDTGQLARSITCRYIKIKKGE